MQAVSEQEDGRKLAPPRARSCVGRLALNFNPQAVDMMHDPFCTMRSITVNSLRSQSYEEIRYFI